MKEIDIIATLKTIFSRKLSLAISIIVGLTFGLVIALNLPKEYTAEVLLAPEMSSGGLGLNESLTDMASSFGINLSSGTKTMDAFYPEVYPEILSSDDFIATLFSVPVRLKDENKTRTYYQHLTTEQKVPFWDYPKAWLAERLEKKESIPSQKSTKDPFRWSKKDMEVCSSIAANVNCAVDKKTSVILISVTDQDPLVAAIVADTIQNRLQSYITDYRTKKARNDFEYYSNLYREARTTYLEAQQKYASFCDANQDVILEQMIAKRDELENNMQTTFNIMSQMSTQMQVAKAKIQERTPSYTVVQSPKMPYKASSTSRAMIVLIILALSVAVDALWVLSQTKSNSGLKKV